jgi:hypothetical protein
MSLWAHEALHLAVGLALVWGVSRLGRRPDAAAWVLVASLSIDLDHWVDYLMTIGFRWDPVALRTGSYFGSSGRVMVLLHSWELAVVLLAASFIVRGVWRGPLLGLGIGMIGHLCVDQFGYSQPWPTYFLVARLLHGFADPIHW